MAVDKNKIIAEATRLVQKGQYDKAIKEYGKLLELDPGLVVSDKRKSIRQGALAVTNESGYILYSRLGPEGWEQMAQAFGFSLDAPWRDLAPEHQRVDLQHGRVLLKESLDG